MGSSIVPTSHFWRQGEWVSDTILNISSPGGSPCTDREAGQVDVFVPQWDLGLR